MGSVTQKTIRAWINFKIQREILLVLFFGDAPGLI